MANCKDCIHCKMCCQNHIERVCKDFKDRSRFVELPIKPGEKVFYFDTAGRIYESTVTQMVYGATGFLIDAEQALFWIDSDVMFNSNLIGERFFLTREEAEQALKEREG